MKTIGLLGGVASGKSLVARLFAEMGAGVLDADAAGHEALRLPRIVAAARQRWGDGIFAADGTINRKQLARIVFATGHEGREERTYLEKLTHPEIARLIEEQKQRLEAAGTPLAILDAALLLEAGWDRLCSDLVYVDVPRQQRLLRAKSRGWTGEHFDSRERAQASLDVKRERARWIVDNSGSPEQTRAQLERIWRYLIG